MDYIATLFGWKRPDGTRRYTENPMMEARALAVAVGMLAGALLGFLVAGTFGCWLILRTFVEAWKRK